MLGRLADIRNAATVGIFTPASGKQCGERLHWTRHRRENSAILEFVARHHFGQ
jgi:hypothetical protein